MLLLMLKLKRILQYVSSFFLLASFSLAFTVYVAPGRSGISLVKVHPLANNISPILYLSVTGILNRIIHIL